MSDHENIILGLLCGLQHFLECLLLMGSVERLNSAMLREEVKKTSDETWVEAILKAGTNREGIITLA